MIGKPHSIGCGLSYRSCRCLPIPQKALSEVRALFFVQYKQLRKMFASLLFIVIMSFVTAILFAVDKHASVRGRWRIPEFVLLSLCAVGGAHGGLAAMYILRHKTHKPYFTQSMPWMIVLQILILIITANIFL